MTQVMTPSIEKETRRGIPLSIKSHQESSWFVSSIETFRAFARGWIAAMIFFVKSSGTGSLGSWTNRRSSSSYPSPNCWQWLHVSKCCLNSFSFGSANWWSKYFVTSRCVHLQFFNFNASLPWTNLIFCVVQLCHDTARYRQSVPGVA